MKFYAAIKGIFYKKKTLRTWKDVHNIMLSLKSNFKFFKLNVCIWFTINIEHLLWAPLV